MSGFFFFGKWHALFLPHISMTIDWVRILNTVSCSLNSCGSKKTLSSWFGLGSHGENVSFQTSPLLSTTLQVGSNSKNSRLSNKWWLQIRLKCTFKCPEALRELEKFEYRFWVRVLYELSQKSIERCRCDWRIGE